MSEKGFKAALGLILRYEGLYDNDPDDPGGETYKGITRRDHPHWEGWKEVDAHKEQDDFPEILEEDESLQSSVAGVYKRSYWDANLCDQLPPGIDLVVFDTAVNMGSRKAGRFLQQGVNNLLEEAILGVDGAIGNKTVAAVNALNQEQQKQLCFAFLELRAQNYHEIVASRPASAKYLKGWLNRVANLKNQVTAAFA